MRSFRAANGHEPAVNLNWPHNATEQFKNCAETFAADCPVRFINAIAISFEPAAVARNPIQLSGCADNTLPTRPLALPHRVIAITIGLRSAAAATVINPSLRCNKRGSTLND